MIRFATPTNAHKVLMRTYGAICAISGISFIAIYLANRNAYGHGKADLYIAEYAAVFLALAAGLLAVRVWAELIFDLCLFCLGLGIVVTMVIDSLAVSQIILDLFILTFLMTPVALCVYRIRHGAYFVRRA